MAGRATRPAVAFRRAAAPYMGERPDLTYGVAALLFMILFAWQPADVFKRPVALLLIAGLMILGPEALRRQTADEFAVCHAGRHGIRESIKSWRAGRARTSSGGAGRSDEARLERLERLTALGERGALSQEEFDAQKAALLG